mgnify:CR=1 FL=1
MNQAIASGPCSIKLNGNQPDLANAGSNSVYNQSTKPSDKPHSAPLRVPFDFTVLPYNDIAAADLEPVFRAKPAIHRYPGSMAERVQALAVHVRDNYDGDAARVPLGGGVGGSDRLARLGGGCGGLGDGDAAGQQGRGQDDALHEFTPRLERRIRGRKGRPRLNQPPPSLHNAGETKKYPPKVHPRRRAHSRLRGRCG